MLVLHNDGVFSDRIIMSYGGGEAHSNESDHSKRSTVGWSFSRHGYY